MKVSVLGCSGGIGRGLRTTALLVDEDILIDAGTGVGDLSLTRMARIAHVFVSHAHLDHIAAIPFIVDAVGPRRRHPLTVHASPETIDLLRQHILNGAIWPDFSVLPSATQPFLVYAPMALGEARVINGRTITALPAEHVVPAVGYLIEDGQRRIAYTGDTGWYPALLAALNRLDRLDDLIIETAFPQARQRLAEVSRHLSPGTTAALLAQLKVNPRVHITHLKPGEETRIMQELRDLLPALSVQALRRGQTL